MSADPQPRRFVRGVTADDRRAPHPKYAVWEITLACDLGCRHCGSRAGKARAEELSTPQALDVVRQLADVGIVELTLIGGEAYLRDDWDQIAAEATRRGMSVGITTGARGLTEERVARAVDAGIRTISISLDGLERTHDALRGAKGSFRSALAAAERLAPTPIRLAVNSQINRLSWPELPAMASMLADIGARAWQIQLTVPMGRAADRPQLLLQPYELGALFPLLVWIKQERLDPAGVGLFPGNNIGYFGPYEARLRPGGERGAHWGGCPAGEWSIGLEADGTIKACPSLPSNQYGGGRTTERSVEEAVAAAAEVTYVKTRTRRDLWGHCRSCYYADVCKAGCTWTSQVTLGRPGNNPFCIHRVETLEAEGIRERIVPVARAPGIPFDQGRFELVEEPCPEQATPDIGRHALADVVGLDWKSGGVWTADEMKDLLRARAPAAKRLRVL